MRNNMIMCKLVYYNNNDFSFGEGKKKKTYRKKPSMNRLFSALDHASRCLLMVYDLRTRELLLPLSSSSLLLLLRAGCEVTGALGAIG